MWKYNSAYTSFNDMIQNIGMIQNVGIRFFMAENLIVDLESCHQVHYIQILLAHILPIAPKLCMCSFN
jgi:hypothetical protein